ncbi:unnamed protein product [Onchocerca flexuosa]|uniref:Transposase n=1 Tax=Onchocerca flexuosa TaxID=387005 RepID=A0A183H8M7_9BILA|nr:unnamed protein product [Onchocerca flexuosa]
MLMLNVGKTPRQRRLSEAKRNRLGRISLKKRNERFRKIIVHWLAKGDKSDEVVFVFFLEMG